MIVIGEKIRVGLVLFPELTQLDLTGPAEVFGRIPGAEIHLLWKTLDPVSSDRGLRILPTTTFAACPELDVICVPGGPGLTVVADLVGDQVAQEIQLQMEYDPAPPYQGDHRAPLRQH
jgi:cyclohexyl-isocyanide hydratase